MWDFITFYERIDHKKLVYKGFRPKASMRLLRVNLVAYRFLRLVWARFARRSRRLPAR